MVVSQRTTSSKFLKMNIFPNYEKILYPSFTMNKNIFFLN